MRGHQLPIWGLHDACLATIIMLIVMVGVVIQDFLLRNYWVVTSPILGPYVIDVNYYYLCVIVCFLSFK